jgi:phosphoribosyl-ATP pyrophosphohydrolase
MRQSPTDKILSQEQNNLHEKIINEAMEALINNFSDNVSIFHGNVQMSFDFILAALFTINRLMFVQIFTNFGVPNRDEIVDEFFLLLKKKINDEINTRMM